MGEGGGGEQGKEGGKRMKTWETRREEGGKGIGGGKRVRKKEIERK